MAGDVRSAREGVKLDSLRIDSLGRVVIADAAVAEKVKGLGAARALDEAAGNGLCCGNTQCLSEDLVSMLNHVVRGGRPG